MGKSWQFRLRKECKRPIFIGTFYRFAPWAECRFPSRGVTYLLSRTNRRDRRGALPQRMPVPMLVLSAFIVLGVILGYVFALRSLQSAGGELKQYFDAFLSGGVNRPFSVRALGETLLCYFRAPGIVFLLGFASIGIVAVPLVCACQGFLLSYSLFCFALSLGRGSFPLLLALFGIRFLAVLPCTLLLGNASLDKSRVLLSLSLGGGGRDAQSATGARTGTALAFVVCVCCLPLCWSCGSCRSFLLLAAS